MQGRTFISLKAEAVLYDTGGCRMGRIHAWLLTEQATDPQIPSTDLANRTSILGAESLDEGFKYSNCLVGLRLSEIYPAKWISEFLVL